MQTARQTPDEEKNLECLVASGGGNHGWLARLSLLGERVALPNDLKLSDDSEMAGRLRKLPTCQLRGVRCSAWLGVIESVGCKPADITLRLKRNSGNKGSS